MESTPGEGETPSSLQTAVEPTSTSPTGGETDLRKGLESNKEQAVDTESYVQFPLQAMMMQYPMGYFPQGMTEMFPGFANADLFGGQSGLIPVFLPMQQMAQGSQFGVHQGRSSFVHGVDPKGANRPRFDSQGARGRRSTGDRPENALLQMPAGSPVSHTQLTNIASPPVKCADDIVGRVLELSRGQLGSRQLQQLLLEGSMASDNTRSVVDIMFGELVPHIADAMLDQYGNYLCQQLFPRLSAAQRDLVFAAIAPRFADISVDAKGTHALQSLISAVTAAKESEMGLREAMKGSVMRLSLDLVGSHVIQKILDTGSDETCLAIAREAVLNLATIVESGYGVCVVKRIMAKLPLGCPELGQLVAGLGQHAREFACHPYANFALQYALQLWGGEICAAIVAPFSGWIVQMSAQKFASNVVEVIIDSTYGDIRASLLNELLEERTLPDLMRNSYSIFVAQKALQVGDPAFCVSFRSALQSNLEQVRGARLLNRWSALIRGEAIETRQTHAAAQASSGASPIVSRVPWSGSNPHPHQQYPRRQPPQFQQQQHAPQQMLPPSMLTQLDLPIFQHSSPGLVQQPVFYGTPGRLPPPQQRRQHRLNQSIHLGGGPPAHPGPGASGGGLLPRPFPPQQQQQQQQQQH